MTHAWIFIAAALNRYPHANERRNWVNRMQSLEHTKWTKGITSCLYRKILYDEVPTHAGKVFRVLALQKESQLKEGYLLPDHMLMMLLISPKDVVLQRGKLHQREKRDSFGPCVHSGSATRRDEEVIRSYICHQEK